MFASGQLRVFAAKIYKVGIIRFVDVPQDISKSLGSGNAHIPVQGTVEGLPLRTTLVPAGNGRHRCAIHGDIYRKLRIDAGAIIEVGIEIDEESREPALPPALIVALKHSPHATKVFRTFSIALRRQIVRYLTSAKNQETVERRVAKFISRLERDPRYSKPKPAKRRSPAKRTSKV